MYNLCSLSITAVILYINNVFGDMFDSGSKDGNLVPTELFVTRLGIRGAPVSLAARRLVESLRGVRVRSLRCTLYVARCEDRPASNCTRIPGMIMI